MKTEELLNLDFSKKENRDKMQKALHKIFPTIQSDKRIPIIALEKYVSFVEKKYDVIINCIIPVYIIGKEDKVHCEIFETTHGSIMKEFFANDLYELYSKICIYYYYLVKVKKIPLKDWGKVNKYFDKGD